MAQVFDPDWIKELHAQYGQRPNYQQPPIYRLATNPEWAEERERVEQWVCLLPENKQNEVIARLREGDQFYTTHNELVVGDWLRQCGHQPEYEKPLGDKIPDWYVPSIGDLPPFYVEVATVFPPPEFQDEMQRWDELRSRLAQIEHYFHLGLSVNPGASLVNKDQKSIVDFVNKWLDGFDPDVTTQQEETTYQDGDLRIRFSLIPRRTRGKAPVATAGPVLIWWVNSQHLRDVLRKKLHKYRQAKYMKIPLVIALVPTFESGFDTDDLLDALFGKEQVTVYWRNDEIIATETGRDRTGIVTPKVQGGKPIMMNTRLSAVLWVTSSQPARAKVIHNPYARFPLYPQVFPELPNLVVVKEEAGFYELGWVKG